MLISAKCKNKLKIKKTMKKELIDELFDEFEKVCKKKKEIEFWNQENA